MQRLEGRAVLITGSAQGIGRAIALAAAAEGAAVAGVDLNGAGATATAEAIRSTGGQAIVFQADVADEAAVRSAIDETVERFGRLDVLCNNAAAFEPKIVATDIDAETTPMATWDRTFDVNLRGPFFAAKFALPHLRRAGGGTILNISTTAGFNGDVVQVAYSTSKAALHQLTRAIATSHGRAGIRCNTIATGLVMSEITQGNPSEKLAVWARHRLIADPGTPEEVAALAVHLCSDDGRYITGQTIVMDGGGSSVHQPWYADAAVLHPEVVGRDV